MNGEDRLADLNRAEQYLKLGKYKEATEIFLSLSFCEVPELYHPKLAFRKLLYSIILTQKKDLKPVFEELKRCLKKEQVANIVKLIFNLHRTKKITLNTHDIKLLNNFLVELEREEDPLPLQIDLLFKDNIPFKEFVTRLSHLLQSICCTKYPLVIDKLLSQSKSPLMLTIYSLGFHLEKESYKRLLRVLKNKLEKKSYLLQLKFIKLFFLGEES